VDDKIADVMKRENSDIVVLLDTSELSTFNEKLDVVGLVIRIKRSPCVTEGVPVRLILD